MNENVLTTILIIIAMIILLICFGYILRKKIDRKKAIMTTTLFGGAKSTEKARDRKLGKYLPVAFLNHIPHNQLSSPKYQKHAFQSA